MSNFNFSGIGEWIKQNQADIAIFIGFILVALIAFGAGRLNALDELRVPVVIDEPLAACSASADFDASGKTADSAAAKGLFVASRGGTKYHWPWCSWGENIKIENQVWFKNENEARQAGYRPCACVANKAPVGYSAE